MPRWELTHDEKLTVGAFFLGEGTCWITKKGELRAKIVLRDDDAEALHWIREKLGGTIYNLSREHERKHHHAGAKDQVQVEWWRAHELRRIIKCVEASPLPAKKKADIALFKKALGHPNKHYRRQIGLEMVRAREYEPSEPNEPKDRWPALF